jgi:hypothetical protein
MQIHVVFEQDELLTNAINQKPFMFMIWWEHEGNTYPCEGWFDRGVYWMLEWFHTVDHLYVSRSRENFRFEMPVEIFAKVERKTGMVKLTSYFYETLWETTVEDIARALVDAAEQVIREFTRLGISKQECELLRKGIATTRKLILADEQKR